jgi:hypothetical protein
LRLRKTQSWVMTSKGATIDVGVWLKGLGRANAIELDVLRDLTDQDLPDGSGSQAWRLLGHRPRLLCRGIRAGRVACHSALREPFLQT